MERTRREKRGKRETRNCDVNDGITIRIASIAVLVMLASFKTSSRLQRVECRGRRVDVGRELTFRCFARNQVKSRATKKKKQSPLYSKWEKFSPRV